MKPTQGEKVVIDFVGKLLAQFKEGSEGEEVVSAENVPGITPIKQAEEYEARYKRQKSNYCQPTIRVIGTPASQDDAIKTLVRVNGVESYLDVEVEDMIPVQYDNTVLFRLISPEGEVIIPYGVVFAVLKKLKTALEDIYNPVNLGGLAEYNALPQEYKDVMNLILECSNVPPQYYQMPTGQHGCPTYAYIIIASDGFGVLFVKSRNYVYLDSEDIDRLIDLIRNIRKGIVFGKRIDLPCIR